MPSKATTNVTIKTHRDHRRLSLLTSLANGNFTPPASQDAVRQRWQAVPHALQVGALDFGHHHPGLFGALGQDLAPGVNHHAVAPGATAILVGATLGCREHVSQV